MPKAHDGATAFRFELRFSKQPAVGFEMLRDEAFEVTGGSVTGARRLASGSNLRWEITVQPASDADVVLTLPVPASCEAEGAICTGGGSKLARAVTATVEGPGAEPAGFPLAPANSSPSGIWSDGETAWVADLDDGRLYAYQRSDGERQPAKDIVTEPAPMGLWSDGDTIWVAGLDGGLRAHRLANGTRLVGRDLALEANEAPAGGRADSVPVIADPALQAAIREALGKAAGEAVSAGELVGLESLNARNSGVRDLAGLEAATPLKELDLGYNPLAELKPLASLPALESLDLDGAALDLGPLASLTGLKRLSIRHNLVDDLRALAPLAGLAELDVGDNRIADLRALVGLTRLAGLFKVQTSEELVELEGGLDNAPAIVA